MSSGADSPGPGTPVHSRKRRRSKNAFGGRIVFIVVGAHREEFNIHAHHLEQTAFFEVHGLPGAQIDMDALNNPPDTSPLDGTNIKQEEDATDELITDASGEPGQPIRIPDYLIAANDWQASPGFQLFVKWVYNLDIPDIKSRASHRYALRAYEYARQYKAFGLQNILIERFRKHYSVFDVRMDELKWVIRHFGDDPNATPLTRYILEQIVHDIAKDGIYSFAGKNGWLRMFLEEGNHKIRFGLVAILARHAQSCANGSRLQDPSNNDRDWRVVETGGRAGEWAPTELSNV